MKHRLLKLEKWIIAALALLVIVIGTVVSNAADQSYLDSISVAPVGAHQQANFASGPAQWGAGVDVLLPVNPFVSLRIRNLSFEGADGRWRGGVVDETAVYGRADFKPLKTDRFYLYGVGGGSRHWDASDWSLGIGAGAEYRFTKNISLGVERTVRAHFKGGRDWLTAAALNLRF